MTKCIEKKGEILSQKEAERKRAAELKKARKAAARAAKYQCIGW